MASIKNIAILFKTLLQAVLLVCMLGPTLIYGQSTGGIKGTVKDHVGNGVPDVVVLLNNGTQKAITNQEGAYQFDNLSAGEYLLRATVFDSWQERKVNLTLTTNATVDFLFHKQERHLESVTVSVNRRTVPSSTLRLSENLLVTPQNIQVIDQSMISDQMLLSTAEGFTRNVSGARTIYHQEEGSAGIAVRGYTASNLRNGMDVSGSFGPLREDMAFVERIEFVKGPAGFMMGNTQPGGFYNIVTKKPHGDGANSARLTLGSFGLYRGEVDLDTKLSKDGKLLGRFNVMGTKKGSHVIYTGNEQFVINPSFKYIASDKTDFTVEYILSQNAFTGGFSKYAYGLAGFKELERGFGFSDPIIDPTVVREHNVYGTVNHYFSDNWMLTGQFGYINSAMEGESLYAKYNTIDSEGNVRRGISINDAVNASTVGQVFAKGKFNIGQVQSNVLVGLDMGTKFYVADWTADTTTVGGLFNIYNPVYGNLRAKDIPQYDRSRSIRERGASTLTEYTYYAVHVQDEIHFLNDRLRVGLGLRYTETTRTSAASSGKRVNNSALTPRFSLTGLLTPTLTAYALYDQSFQEQTGTQLNGNPVDPSRGINSEVGLKKSWFQGNLLAGVTAYHLVKTNITSTAGPDNPGFVEHVGEATSKGIEVDINGRLSPSWNVMFNYAYTDAKVTEDNDAAKVGQMLYGTAKHITNAWLRYTIVDGPIHGLGFSAGYELQAKRAAWPVTVEKYLPDDLFSVDLGISFKRDAYQLGLLVNNVLDRYNYTGFYPGAWGYKHYGWRSLPPRGFRLTLAYKF